MSVTIRPYDGGGWEYDIRFAYPTGQRSESVKRPR